MNNRIFRAVKRLDGCISTSGSNKDPKIRALWLSSVRNRADVAMLEPEKYPETTIVHSEIFNNLTWLHKVAPGFPVNGSKITVIHEPKVFYATLMEKCKKVQSRVTLASLYLGTGPLETELVEAINESVQRSDGKVSVTVLLDYMRGTRGERNSCSMLETLMSRDKSDACRIFLYHTPKLRGLLKKIIPHRFNELIGLQHMKLYIFDDTLIISGANLSNDYFTNRQDRYFVIEDCKELCDFYQSLVERVGEFSYRLSAESGASRPALNVDPVVTPSDEFARIAGDRIRTLFQSEMDKRNDTSVSARNSESDTWIFPLVEMAQLGIHHDSKVTLKLLQTAPPGSTLRLATGYFNLTPEYTNAILRYCRAACHLLTAHPTANGFFGAKGPAGGIPAAYTRMEKSFYEKSVKFRQSDRITLREFVRPGWTYHAKGLWFTLPGETKPCLTLIGSPNFGYRSVKRDLETQVAIVTKNPELQSSLQNEHERLFDRSNLVTKQSFSQRDRIAPTWVCAVVLMFRYYF